jgi:hypothetical protein
MVEMRSELTARLDFIYRSMIYLAVSLTGGMIAGFAAMIAFVSTQA